MTQNYPSLAFTYSVKKMQEQAGSRAVYARMEKRLYSDGLRENEMEFINERDNFYIASIGENGYPYIQHRGGPKGFLKVLDAWHLGFIDFVGNAQYITMGNIVTHPHVSLIMVDYASRTRLKIYARASIVELSDDMELYKSLDLNDYDFKPERMVVLEVDAFDWNCPQHITPRYTLEEIDTIIQAQSAYITQLETELAK